MFRFIAAAWLDWNLVNHLVNRQPIPPQLQRSACQENVGAVRRLIQ